MKKLTVLLAALLCSGPVFAQGYYTGSAGGRGTLIAIKTPEGEGLLTEERYLLTLVQSVLLEDFTRFSDMTVIDRQNITELLKETESSLYREDSGAAQAGKMEMPRYMLGGTITKTSNFLISLSITDTTDGSVKATYTDNASRDSMDDFSSINKAAEKLLNQMGITLTAAGRAQMYHVTDDDRDAGLTLARGLSAADNQGQGGIINVAAMNYLFQAQSYERTAVEANARLNALELRQAEDDIGAKMMTEFALHDEWQKTLDGYTEFYALHPPFDFYYTVPSGNILDFGDGKTNPGSYKVTFKAGLRWDSNSLAVMKKVLDEITTQLNAQKKALGWDREFTWWPQEIPVFQNEYTYNITADVVNGANAKITTVNFKLKGSLYLQNKNSIAAWCDQEFEVDTGRLTRTMNLDLTGLTIRITTINNIDAESAGRNGIVKVVMVENLPQEQKKPSAFVDAEKRQEKERQRREQERQREEKKMAAKEAKANSVFDWRLGLFFSGGPYLGPSAGNLNIGLEGGIGRFDIEFSAFVPLGLTDPAHPATDVYEDPSFMGGSFGAGYSLYGKKWLLVVGGGIEFIDVYQTKKSEDSTLESSDDDTERQSLDTIVFPFIQARFDWAVLTYNGLFWGKNALTVRIGYRLDFYPADKYDLYFNKPRSKIMGFKMVDNLFVGLALML